MKKVIHRSFIKTTPVLVGYLALGTAYGILMRVNGLGIIWTLVSSILVFAGSLQYVGINFLAAMVNPLYAFLMSIMINARHIFYGISMLNKYKDIKMKPYLIFGLTDETFSIVVKEEDKSLYFWITLLDHLYWISGSLIGNILGNFIPFKCAGHGINLGGESPL